MGVIQGRHDTDGVDRIGEGEDGYMKKARVEEDECERGAKSTTRARQMSGEKRVQWTGF